LEYATNEVRYLQKGLTRTKKKTPAVLPQRGFNVSKSTDLRQRQIRIRGERQCLYLWKIRLRSQLYHPKLVLRHQS